ncbi:MAG: hydroxymethylbilane synthase [Nanoarchaeota archaeon]|nr:hydroxymethylbilane synthase [Nanoarchaeota archaeon]
MEGRILIIGTRGSTLAMEQARRVKAALPGESRIQIIQTSGDRFTEQPLGEQNPVGFFTKEIQEALLARRIDVAVHSLKDLPTLEPPGLALAAMMKRDDPGDLLLVRPVSHDPGNEIPLKTGSVVGASSRRRQAMLQLLRPDIVPRPIRGNMPTRVDKVRRGDFDAVIISRAGMERLAFDVKPLLPFDLNPCRWPGAPGQAIIAIEVRVDDGKAFGRAAVMDDKDTHTRAQAERSLLAAFGGGCHAPFGAYSKVEEGRTWMFVSAPTADDGFKVVRFQGPDLEGARSGAEQWVRSGRKYTGDIKEEEWLCRPARPWC